MPKYKKKKNRKFKVRRRPRKAPRTTMDKLKAGFQGLAAAAPIVGHFVNQFQDDPTEQHLSDLVDMGQQFAEAHIAQQAEILDTLADMSGLVDIGQQLVEMHTTQQAEILDTLADIWDALEDYRRPDIFGQLTAFSTLAEAVTQIRRLADNTEHIANSLRGIEENNKSLDLRGARFPAHLHSYVRMMIERHGNDSVPHYFAIFHRSTLWHPQFADCERENPLGPSYLGHKTDLDELVAFLVQEVRPRVGPKPVLHILMPTIGQLALKEAVKFPDAMRPFVVDGELGDAGTPFVYMCLTEDVDKQCLRNIGVLRPRDIWVLGYAFGIPHLYLLTGSKFFWRTPKPRYFVDPPFGIRSAATFLVGAIEYEILGPEPPRILGERTTRPWG